MGLASQQSRRNFLWSLTNVLTCGPQSGDVTPDPKVVVSRSVTNRGWRESRRDVRGKGLRGRSHYSRAAPWEATLAGPGSGGAAALLCLVPAHLVLMSTHKKTQLGSVARRSVRGKNNMFLQSLKSKTSRDTV
ncbi:hypothetical protein RRG08_028313 [Elysia crispata]|uniref:Uncharacterized protein n=1 Tax=Elysia crispata TaxID=231223 RepID=A0AAE1AWD8_9GAST|nr:hypothetical protein RRG08_028313 [Elysia crispata]